MYLSAPAIMCMTVDALLNLSLFALYLLWYGGSPELRAKEEKQVSKLMHPKELPNSQNNLALCPYRTEFSHLSVTSGDSRAHTCAVVASAECGHPISRHSPAASLPASSL